MFKTTFGFLCWSCVCLSVAYAQKPAGGQAPETPVYRSNQQLVVVPVTVTDGEDRLVPDLSQDDFHVFDNEQPQQIRLFLNDSQRISVVVLLDSSASMTSNLGLLREAAEQFLLRLFPGDLGRVGAFNDKVEFYSDFSADRDHLVSALASLSFGNQTRLYDALHAALETLRSRDGRRVILVFTDGADTASRTEFGTILQRAVKDAVMVYAIGLGGEAFHGPRRIRTRPDKGLKKLAEDTGGGFFKLQRSDELGPTFTRVARELHSQYLLGFHPAKLDGKLHKLTVRLRRLGLRARTRATYLAEEREGR